MKKDEPMRNINPFGLRLQPALKAKLEEAADENKRSLNAEISARLEESFLDDLPAKDSLVQIIAEMATQIRELSEQMKEMNKPQDQ